MHLREVDQLSQIVISNVLFHPNDVIQLLLHSEK